MITDEIVKELDDMAKPYVSQILGGIKDHDSYMMTAGILQGIRMSIERTGVVIEAMHKRDE